MYGSNGDDNHSNEIVENNIVDIAHELGLVDVDLEGVQELIRRDEEDLSNEDLIEELHNENEHILSDTEAKPNFNYPNNVESICFDK